MIEIPLVWLLIAIELFLVLAIALAGLLLAAFQRRRRDHQAARYLVEAIKQAEPQRAATTRELLKQHYGYSGESLEQTLRTIMRAEKLLYQRVLNLYIKHDALALRMLPIEVEALSEPLRGLRVLSEGAAPAADAGSAAVSAEELARLQAENESLQQELQITMETMSRMLSEYAAMFGGGPQTAQSQTFKTLLAETPDEVPPNTPPDSAGDSESSGLEGLGELEEINSFDVELDWEGSEATAAPPDTDAGRVLGDGLGDGLEGLGPEQGSRIDLSDDTPIGAEKSDSPPDMDEDLADIWAAALEEQETTAKPKS